MENQCKRCVNMRSCIDVFGETSIMVNSHLLCKCYIEKSRSNTTVTTKIQILEEATEQITSYAINEELRTPRAGYNVLIGEALCWVSKEDIEHVIVDV